MADGLCTGTSGNLSVRVPEGILVTPSGLDPAVMTPADPVLVSPSGEVLDGTRRPTSELAMHLTTYRLTDAAAVVHTHSPYATVLATTLDELPAIHYLVVQLGGPVRVAAYATFGTPELAANLAAALEGRSAALLQNHGALTCGAYARPGVRPGGAARVALRAALASAAGGSTADRSTRASCEPCRTSSPVSATAKGG